MTLSLLGLTWARVLTPVRKTENEHNHTSVYFKQPSTDSPPYTSTHMRHKRTGPHYNDHNRGTEHIMHNNLLFTESGVKDKTPPQNSHNDIQGGNSLTNTSKQWNQIEYKMFYHTVHQSNKSVCNTVWSPNKQRYSKCVPQAALWISSWLLSFFLWSFWLCCKIVSYLPLPSAIILLLFCC